MSTQTVTKRKFKVSLPKLYTHVFHNNNTTTFDMVVFVMTNAFNFPLDKAVKYTQKIHDEGKCAVFTGTKEACDFKYQLVESIKQSKQEKDLKHEIVPIDTEV